MDAFVKNKNLSSFVLIALSFAFCFIYINSLAIPPRVPYYYDPVTKTIKKTPVPKKPAGVDAPSIPRRAVLGMRKCIVILLEFSDTLANIASHPSSAYDDLLFSNGVVSTGSMKEFYEEASYGQFTVGGQVTAWTMAPQTYAYYVGGYYGFGSWPTNAQRMAYDACSQVDSYVDFSQYDNDGPDGIANSGDDDGYVDGLFIVHAGPGAEETGNPNDIWSHKWGIPYGGYVTNDPRNGGGFIKCYTYSTEPEEFADGSLQTMGVFAHEFCHVIGMPDLYDYDSGYINIWDDDNNPLFDWCLMSHGSWGGPTGWGDGSVPSHPCAYIKMLLGWISPTVLTSSQYNIPIEEIETTNGSQSLYEVVINSFGPGVNEYFLIENRNPNSLAMFDKYDNNNYNAQTQKDGGIVIYHIDERYPANDNGPYDPHYTVWTEDPGMIFDPMDPYNGVLGLEYQLKSDAAYALEDTQVDFNLSTGQIYHYLFPSSDTNDGSNSGVAIRVATSSGSSMLFHLGLGHEAKVTAPPPQAGGAGDDLYFDFTVTNPGGYNETYDLTATSSHSFPLTYPSTVGPIDPFESQVVTVVLHIPVSYTSKTIDVLTLRATSQADATVWDESSTGVPVAVEVSNTSVLFNRDAVELAWEVASGASNPNFDIFRSSESEAFQRINDHSITGGPKFHYVDRNIEYGVTYDYKVVTLGKDGKEHEYYLGEVAVPYAKLELNQNVPNPFNPATTISFHLPQASKVTLSIFNSRGRRVRTIINKKSLSSGPHELQWNGLDETGKRVASGVYFCQLESGERKLIRKMVIVR